jgi:hypothetical protein
MSVIPASCLSGSDLALLGNNLRPAVRTDRLQVQAVNRSLAVQGEEVQKLYRLRSRRAPAAPRTRRLDA